MARIKFVKEIKRLSCDDWRGWAWLAERMFASEFARPVARIEQIGEQQADDKKMGLTILYNNTSGQPLSELLSFPQHPSMAIGYDAWAEREKQRRLAEESGATEKAPEEIEEGLGSNQSAELAVFKENR